MEEKIFPLWKDAEAAGDRRFPHEYIYDLLMHGDIELDGDPMDSWLMAAADANLPIFTPGWEDSTLGNILVAPSDRSINLITRYRVEWTSFNARTS